MPLNISPSEKSELAVTLAALILHDEKAPISAENIQKLLTAAKVADVEPYWPKLFASLLEGKDVSALLLSSGGSVGAGGAAPTGGAPTTTGGPKKEEAKEEPKKKEESAESEADMGFSLFD